MRKRFWVSLALILVFGVAMTQIAPCLGQSDKRRPRSWGWDFTEEDWVRVKETISLYFLVKGIISTITTVLLLIIVVIHINIYRRTGARFSLGLILFSLALLLYTIFANPYVYSLIRARALMIFGPILIIPDTLTLIASAILIYLSRQ